MQDELDLWQLDMSALSERLHRGQLSATTLLQVSDQRRDAVNAAINAIVTLNPAAASEARESDRRLAAGNPRSPLEGIPVTVKDNLLTAGVRTTWGSRLYERHVPGHDELPVARLRAAGAVIIGKTNVPEFTVEGYTANELFGVTRNPWNPALTPGGSSGGAVAAVAAGIGAAAIGTDGGGSIRRPAAFAGLVGFKPSLGRIPRYGGFPRLLLDMEVVGPICRSVADTRLMLRCLQGSDVRDQNSLHTWTPAATRSPHLRILYVPRIGNAPVDAEIESSVAAAAHALAAMGHEVREDELPFDIQALVDVWPEIGQVGVARLLHDTGAAPDLIGPVASELAVSGMRVTVCRFAHIVEVIDAFRAEVSRSLQTLDLILTPASAALPWPAEQACPDIIAGTPVGPRGHAVFSGWVNAAGLPAVTLPSRPSADGMPIGIQLVAPFGHDDQLLDFAAVFEAAMPWSHRWPALSKERRAEA